MTRAKQTAREMAAVQEEMRAFREVPMPVDVTDAEAFPEIARAIEHARRLKEAKP